MITLGTGVIADFPTREGNINPKQVLETLVDNSELRLRIAEGQLTGGVLQPGSVSPIENILTHTVTNIRLFRDEIVVDIELLDTEIGLSLFQAIERPQAAIIVACPEEIGSGCIIDQIKGIRAVHIRAQG